MNFERFFPSKKHPGTPETTEEWLERSEQKTAEYNRAQEGDATVDQAEEGQG